MSSGTGSELRLGARKLDSPVRACLPESGHPKHGTDIKHEKGLVIGNIKFQNNNIEERGDL